MKLRMVLGGQQDQVNSIRVIKLMRIARTLRIVKTVTRLARAFFFLWGGVFSRSESRPEKSGADDRDQLQEVVAKQIMKHVYTYRSSCIVYIIILIWWVLHMDVSHRSNCFGNFDFLWGLAWPVSVLCFGPWFS